MKADKTAKTFPTYRILAFEVWQFYQLFILPVEEKAFVLAHFTKQNIFFQKNDAQNQRAKLIF